MSSRLFRLAAMAAAVILVCTVGILSGREGQGAEPAKSSGEAKGRQMMMQRGGPRMHSHGQVTPKGWRFKLPRGSEEAGRQTFVALDCFKCHIVQGEDFPVPKADQSGVGPDLTGMGAMHPAEYFAEVIMNPNASAAWRVKHHKGELKGYLAADGTSKMPSYNDALTVQQLIDLVTYLTSLTGGRPDAPHEAHTSHGSTSTPGRSPSPSASPPPPTPHKH